MFEEDFAGRVLPFDEPAAHAYAQLTAERRQAGQPMAQFDAQIAAIARSRGAGLATRNAMDFDGCGVQVFNPWREG
jgi:predicted nucleic acid-binding protein